MRGKKGRKQGRNMRKWGGSKVGYKARKREVKMRAELNSMRDTCMAIEGNVEMKRLDFLEIVLPP